MDLPGVHIPEGEDGALPAVDIALGPLGGGHTHTRGHWTDTKVAPVSQVSLQPVSGPVSVISSAAPRTLLMLSLPDRALWPAQAKQAPEKVPFDHLDPTQPAAEQSPRVGAQRGSRCHSQHSGSDGF